MDMLVSAVSEMWDVMSPTTWLPGGGLMIACIRIGETGGKHVSNRIDRRRG